MFTFTRFVTLSLALLGAAVHAAPAARPVAPPSSPPSGNNGSYIVTLKPSSVARRGFHGLASAHYTLLSSFASSSEAHIKYEWPQLNAFAGHFSDGALAALRASRDVAAIERDTAGGLSGLGAVTTQPDAPWGLARISQVAPVHPRNDSALVYTYTYDASAGQGVDVYVVDTGINVEHSEFEGRARWGATFGGYADVDANGHGTHVAGIVAGKRFGVAKAANVVAVRVANDAGNGLVSDAIAAVNWIIEEVTTKTHAPSVINVSLWYYASEALDAALVAAVNAGIHVVVSAGNFRVDAATFSPARVPELITVGSTTINDTMSWYNNYGPVVDLLAPGENIISALHTEPDGGYTSMTGTSMAAPHVAGLVAYMVALEGDKPPAEVLARIKERSPDGVIVDVTNLPKGTVNKLIDNGVTL